MKYILILLWFSISLFGSYIKSEIESVNGDEVTIKIDEIQKGISGFVVHKLSNNRSTIVNSVRVVDYDKEAKVAKLKLLDFTMFRNNNLPSLKYKAQKGDIVILAFGYNRGLLIAPNEEIYYILTKAMKGELFVHPDVFATLLSYNGHPSPLKSDFTGFCNNVSVGLVFFYIEKNLYTVDCNSFKILNVQKAPLKQEKTQKPFYSRVEKIDANWFGEGSDEIENYEQYYKELLEEYNDDYFDED